MHVRTCDHEAGAERDEFRQIVADVSPTGSIRVVDEMKAAPRLGAGVRESGLLSETSMRQALESLTRMATLARQLGAGRWWRTGEPGAASARSVVMVYGQ